MGENLPKHNDGCACQTAIVVFLQGGCPHVLEFIKVLHQREWYGQWVEIKYTDSLGFFHVISPAVDIAVAVAAGIFIVVVVVHSYKREAAAWMC